MIMNKIILVVLLSIGMNSQDAAVSVAPLKIGRRPPVYLHPYPCPPSSFSFNKPNCSCPAILSGTKGKGYWLTGHTLETGTPFGYRFDIVSVTFSRKFCRVPHVALSLRGFDTEHKINQRLQVHAESITTTGFNIRVATWADTKIYGVETGYVAFV